MVICPIRAELITPLPILPRPLSPNQTGYAPAFCFISGASERPGGRGRSEKGSMGRGGKGRAGGEVEGEGREEGEGSRCVFERAEGGERTRQTCQSSTTIIRPTCALSTRGACVRTMCSPVVLKRESRANGEGTSTENFFEPDPHPHPRAQPTHPYTRSHSTHFRRPTLAEMTQARHVEDTIGMTMPTISERSVVLGRVTAGACTRASHARAASSDRNSREHDTREGHTHGFITAGSQIIGDQSCRSTVAKTGE